MKKWIHIVAVTVMLMGAAYAQDIPTLEKQLKTEKSPARLADINNLLAEAYLKKDGNKAISYAKAAIKYATTSRNNNVKAEALNFQAKATAGIYAPSGKVPKKNSRGAREYHDAKSLYGKSLKLAKSIGYTQLELDNLENLAYLNTKKIGRHNPDKREELKYYKAYVTRIKQIKKVTKPKATFTAPPSTTNNNVTKPSSPTATTPVAASAGTTKIIRELKSDKAKLTKRVGSLRGEVSGLEREVKTLSTKLTTVNAKLKKALDSGTSKAEIEKLKREQQQIEQDLKQKNRKTRERYKKEKAKLTKERDAATLEKELAETKAKRTQQGLLFGGGTAALVLSFLFIGYRTQKRARKKLAEKNEEIENEKERSEALLLNILPSNIAEELKTQGHANARKHDDVSVFFSDFKNFTKVSEVLSPEELVMELDFLFKWFDHFISRYPSIEKIKTIGDAYMCCAGLSGDDKDATGDIIKAAMDIQEFLFNYKADRQAENLPFFEARIGIHTGPIVAGVVGDKKFAYDIWGDTVNVASRMESNGEVGKVNISADTYERIRYQFSCHSRGKIQVKNKGLIEMYFVDKSYA